MKKAFTLIELLAVIVIIAIVGTIGTYSITKIINNVRVDSLSSTALATKRAVKNYINSTSIEYNNDKASITILSIENSINLGIMEVSKDPWGKDYQEIFAYITKNDNKKAIDIYIKTGDGQWWLLDNEEKEVSKLSFNLAKASLSDNPVYKNIPFKIFISVPKVYIIDSLTATINKNSATFGSLTEESIGLYSITVNIGTDSENYNIDLNISGKNNNGESVGPITINTGNFNAVKSINLTAITNGELKVANEATSFQVLYKVDSAYGNPTGSGFIHEIKYNTNAGYSAITPTCTLNSGTNYTCSYTHTNSLGAYKSFTVSPTITNIKVTKGVVSDDLVVSIPINFICAPFNVRNGIFGVESRYESTTYYEWTEGNFYFRLNPSGTSYYRLFFTSSYDDPSRFVLYKKNTSTSEVVVANYTAAFPTDWNNAFFSGTKKISGTITFNNGTISATLGRLTNISLSYTDSSPLAAGSYKPVLTTYSDPDVYPVETWTANAGAITSFTCNDT